MPHSLQLPPRVASLAPFLLLTWLHMLTLTWRYLAFGLSQPQADLHTLFQISAWLFYSFLYTVPLLLPGLLAGIFRARHAGLATAAALFISCCLLVLVRTDSMIYDLYAFHINSFVLNLIFTPGGISSLGSGQESYVSFALIVLRIVAVQIALLVISRRLVRVRANRRLVWRTSAAFVALFLIQGTVYGISDVQNFGPVLDGSKAYPLFQRVRFRSAAARLGIKHESRGEFAADVETSPLLYPRKPMQFAAVAKPPNVIMLVAESLRWDQLTPEIMPESWAFAERAQRYTNHYSSGNGTREALFGLFYGLYGSYWGSFMATGQPPLLMDRMQQLGYALDLRTSALFTYPEFDKTLFARVPAAALHTADAALPAWQRDAVNTDELLAFLEQRDPEQPFMEFFFLESTHAPYSFPDDQALFSAYQRDVNYATLTRESLAGNVAPLLNRYHNAAHWIDRQLGRIYRKLEQEGLLDNTIVIVTGDHGEEFMEKGAWGHNSAFVEEQVHVPLIVARPGQAPAVTDTLTSHLDIATTLLQDLGAGNAAADYSLGVPLGEAGGRDYIVISDWHSIGVMTADMKYRIPYINGRGSDYWPPVDHADATLPDTEADALVGRYRDLILQAMKNCSLFFVGRDPLPPT